MLVPAQLLASEDQLTSASFDGFCFGAQHREPEPEVRIDDPVQAPLGVSERCAHRYLASYDPSLLEAVRDLLEVLAHPAAELPVADSFMA
jgi:hypothetical protein